VEVTVEKLGPCQARVSFTVPSAEFQGQVRRSLSEAGRNVRMKGFRPGHVPPAVIEKQMGPQVRRDAIEHFARQAYERAVTENKLKVVGSSRLDLDSISVLEGADLAQQFEVSLRPEIELGEYKGLSIESELEPVMEQEVDSAIDSFKTQQAHPEAAGEEGLPLFGLALAKVSWLHGDEVVLERDGLRLSPETPSPGTDPEAFKAAMLGAKDGETREVPLEFPMDFERVDLRGGKGVCRIQISQAYRMVPPSEADVLKFFQAEDETALKRIVREKIAEAKREREEARQEAALLSQVIDAHPFDLPDLLVDQQTDARLAEMRRESEAAKAAESTGESGEPGATPALSSDDLAAIDARRDEVKAAAVKGLRALFLVQQIAETESLLVNNDDMRTELEGIAKRNNATLEEVAAYYKENRLFDQMAIEILERKVRRFLREKAQIQEPK
jgi:trigger factor